ncbi:MAG: type VI secretion system baseplate subunit TssG [Pseudomonadota bacterium]
MIDQLLTHPHRFEFFQAVRLIELWLRQNGVEDGPIPMQYLRFENSLSLSFPPSQIAALAAVADVPVDSAAALQRAALENRLRHIAITPAFIGLLSGNGGLPNHDVMRIANYEYTTKDTGPRAFLDMLSTRSVGLFYQAWARHRPQCMGDAAGNDQFLALLLALSGLRPPANRTAPASSDDAGLGDEVLAYHAAQFRSRCVPASVVAGVLTEYFGVPFALEQLVGRWEDLPSRYRVRLGGANRTLGAGVTLGRRIHRRDSHARLRVGPLKRDDFERFLPHSAGAAAINKVLAMFCGAGMTFEVELVLRAEDVRPLQLPKDDGARRARLGIDAFLFQGAPRDRTTARYHLRP